jgi:folylpolyglutamate synthase/dihydropteroate synthase
MWVVEYYRHLAKLNNVKIRIHVNGTRGKSSVSRLIAGAFREAGYKTLCKTTGTFASIIFPDGHEELINRKGCSQYW